jgi:hypothetical protein
VVLDESQEVLDGINTSVEVLARHLANGEMVYGKYIERKFNICGTLLLR